MFSTLEEMKNIHRQLKKDHPTKGEKTILFILIISVVIALFCIFSIGFTFGSAIQYFLGIPWLPVLFGLASVVLSIYPVATTKG